MIRPHNRVKIFYWQGIGKDKNYTKGICTARDVNDLREQLLKKQILLCKFQRKFFGQHINTKQLTFILDQILTFLRAGVPILKSLEIIRDNEKSRQIAWRIEDIKNKIEAGGKLSESLILLSPEKEKVTLEFLSVGERSGHLLEVLERLVRQREQEEKIHAQLKRAVSYPAFLIVSSMSALILLMIWVVPEFKQTYEDMGTTLPDYTANTLKFSSMLKTYSPAIAAGLFLLGVCLTILNRFVPRVRWILTRLQLQIPIIKNLFTAYFCRHFASNMSIVYQSGIPLEEALMQFSISGIHPVYCAALKHIQQSINRGQNLHQAIKNSYFFPAFVHQVIQAGEHSGTLEQAFKKIEQHYDEKLKNAINTLIQLLEPILITGIAICVGWLIMAIYLPIFNLGLIL